MRTFFVSKFRFYLVFCSVIFAFCSVGGRLVWLQVWNAERYSEIASNARKKVSTIKARRGDIVDSKGYLLATTRSVVDVGMDPHVLDDDDRVKWGTLSNYLGISLEDLELASRSKSVTDESGKFVRDKRWVKLREDIDEGTYRKIQELQIKGIYGNYKHSRLYPNKKLGSHLIGYVNKEGTPAMGVERFTDYYLRGQDGWRESEKDGRRREMPHHRTFEVSPSDGLNVELSIDRRIQDIVQQELDKIVQDFNPLSASAIVSDPKSGYLLALANAPDFDPNLFNTSELSNQRNRALSDLYEPGSTFKIVAVGGAMDEGLVNENSLIDCRVSTFQSGSRKLRLPSDHHPLGNISVSKVVQKSSNRGAARLGIMLGAERLYQYCKSFGFGQKTDFGIGGERRGTLAEPKKWDGLTITRLPIGHAVSVTPMQIHAAMACVANEGILMRPQFISRVFDNAGKTIVPFDPKPVRRVLSTGTASKLSEMLASVVTPEGTARRGAIDGFNVAGKTGTTQKIIDGKYSNRHHVASFVGFFPAENPRLVITVVVDEPKMKKGLLGYGGVVAAPSFQRIGSAIASYLGMQPKKKNDELAVKQRNVKGSI